MQQKLAAIALHDTGRHEVAVAPVGAVRVARVGVAIAALANNNRVLLALLDFKFVYPAQTAAAAAARGPLPTTATTTADSHYRNVAAKIGSPPVGACKLIGAVYMWGRTG